MGKLTESARTSKQTTNNRHQASAPLQRDHVLSQDLRRFFCDSSPNSELRTPSRGAGGDILLKLGKMINVTDWTGGQQTARF
jgi:hypothetical protein